MSIPQMSIYHFGGQHNGALQENVNLLRGDVSFSSPLYTLSGAGGMDLAVTALYQSSEAFTYKNSNAQNPTGILGLGWQMDHSMIVCDPKPERTAGEQDYYLQGGGEQSPLYLVNEPWRRGTLSLDLLSDLKSKTMTPKLKAAFSETGIPLAEPAVIRGEGSGFLIDDGWQILRAEPADGEIRVFDGGLAFENAAFDYARISFYPSLACWSVTDSDGRVSAFGKEDTCLEWAVYTGPGKSRGMVRAYHLCRMTGLWGNRHDYRYQQIRQEVVGSGLSYTKACYLDSIADGTGRRVAFVYGDKLYEAGEGGRREYIDPHKPDPDDRPNRYQDRYETRYLRQIRGLRSDGSLINAVEFSYELHNYSTENGEFVKRTLASIKKTEENGCSLPETRFQYGTAASSAPGALTEVLYPEGGRVRYHYSRTELPVCAKRSLTLTHPWGEGHEQVWFGPDYAVTAFGNENNSRVELYTWLGHFQAFKPEKSLLDGIALEDLQVHCTNDYVLLYPKRSSGATPFVVFHKDSRVLGSWHVFTEMLENPPSQAAAGNLFFAFVEQRSKKLTGYRWDPLAENWFEDTPSMASAGREESLFLGTDGYYLAVLLVDWAGAPGHKRSALHVFAHSRLRGFYPTDTQALPALEIAGTPEEALVTVGLANGLLSLTTVLSGMVQSFRYELALWEISEDGKLSQTLRRQYECRLGSARDVPAEQYAALVCSSGFVASCGNLLRFHEGAWIENNALAPTGPGAAYFACVEDGLVCACQKEGEVTVSAVAFTGQVRWQTLELVHVRSEEITPYLPTATQEYITVGSSLYPRGRGDWAEALGAPPESISLSSHIINAAPHYIAGVDGDVGRVYPFIGSVMYPAERLDDYPAVPAQGQVGFLYTRFPQKDAQRITLYRMADNFATKPWANSRVDAVELDDGMDTVTWRYEYENETARCDPSGLFVKHYKVRVYSGEDYVQYQYHSSLGTVRPDENPTDPAVLDGQLEETQSYSGDRRLSESQFSYEYAYTVARAPGEPDDRRIYGAVLRFARTQSETDGVISVTSHRYDPTSGLQAEEVKDNTDWSGKAEQHRELVKYAFEYYPILWYQNRLTQTAHKKTSVQGETTVITQANANTFRPYPGKAGRVVWAPEGDYEWLGMRHEADTSDFSFVKTSPDWEAVSLVERRTEDGLRAEWQTPIGIVGSVLYDRFGIHKIALFPNARLSAGEALSCGFEPYETPLPGWEDLPLTSKASNTGASCLFQAAGVIIPPLSWVVTPSTSRYRFSIWCRAEQGAAVRIRTPSSEEICAVPAKAGWQYVEKIITLTEKTPLTVTLENGGQDVWWDDLAFSVYETAAVCSVYEKERLCARLGPVNQQQHSLYDAYHRDIGLVNGQEGLLQVPYLARMQESSIAQSPNALWNIKPTADLQYNRFYEDQPLSGGWYSGGGALTHEDAAEGAVSLAPLSERGGYCHITVERHGDKVGCRVGEISLCWENGTWTLSYPGGEEAASAAAPGTDWLIWADEALYFWADGNLLFQRELATPLTGEFSVFAAGEMVCRQCVMGSQGQLGVQFLDGGGKQRQGQFWEGKCCTVTAQVYDDHGRSAVHTKAAFVTDSLLRYRRGFVRSFDWNTGVMEGEVSDYYPADEGYPYIRQRFDNRLTQRVVEQGAQGKPFAITPSGEPHTVRTEYGNQDGLYYRSKQTDQDGNVRVVLTDRLGRKVSESVWLDEEGTQQLVTSVRTRYEKTSITEEVCLPAGQKSGKGFLRTTIRDFRGRVVSQREPNGGQTVYLYDRQGRLRFSMDEELKKQGRIAYRKYDPFERLAEEGIFDGVWDEEDLQKKADLPGYPDVTPYRRYTYDGDEKECNDAGRLTQAEILEPSEQVTYLHYAYDEKGRIIRNETSAGEQMIQEYAYDGAGQLRAHTYASGKQVFYEYDRSGHVQRISDMDGPIASYAYNAMDLVESETKRDIATKYSYNSLGWRTLSENKLLREESVYNRPDGTGFFSGKPSEISTQLSIEKEGFPKKIHYAIDYDRAGRVREAECRVDDMMMPEWSIVRCTYDENGNMTQDGNRGYVYQPGSDRLLTSPEGSYAYNENGGVVSAPAIKQIELHPYHRMPHTIQTDADTIALRYGTDGKRLTKTTGEERRMYLNNGGGRVMEERVGDRNTEYVYGPLGLCALYDKGALYSPVLDRLGSVRALVQPDGKTAGFQYSPYGRMRSSEALDTQVLRHYFTGYELDPETGLYNAGARLYDPKIGRFYSVDPKLSDSSPYLYASGDPFSFTDPTGESSWWGILIGAVVSVAIFAATMGAGVALLGTGAAVMAAVGAVGGAASTVAGSVVTCATDQEPITAKVLLSSFASGAVAGAAGVAVGGKVATAIMSQAIEAQFSIAGTARLGALAAVASGGSAGGVSGVAGTAVGSLVQGNPLSAFSSGQAWANIGVSTLIGMGMGLLSSGVHFARYNVQTVPLTTAGLRELYNNSENYLHPRIDIIIYGDLRYDRISEGNIPVSVFMDAVPGYAFVRRGFGTMRIISMDDLVMAELEERLLSPNPKTPSLYSAGLSSGSVSQTAKSLAIMRTPDGVQRIQKLKEERFWA